MKASVYLARKGSRKPRYESALAQINARHAAGNRALAEALDVSRGVLSICGISVLEMPQNAGFELRLCVRPDCWLVHRLSGDINERQGISHDAAVEYAVAGLLYEAAKIRAKPRTND